MARIDNLSNFLTDVASAIKEKNKITTPILAKDFDTEILNIKSGGSGRNIFTSLYIYTGVSPTTDTEAYIVELENAQQQEGAIYQIHIIGLVAGAVEVIATIPISPLVRTEENGSIGYLGEFSFGGEDGMFGIAEEDAFEAGPIFGGRAFGTVMISHSFIRDCLGFVIEQVS